MKLKSLGSRFEFTPLQLPGVVAVRRRPLGDQRGSLSRLFCADELAAVGWVWPMSQVNHSRTDLAGTARGLHFQYPPHAEAKLVSCIKGRVWDVAVDLRKESPTYLQWCAQEISDENDTALLIPPGCAHGFQALTDRVELIYGHSAPYDSDAEGGLSPVDPRLSIAWPLPVANLSQRDTSWPFLDETFPGLCLAAQG
jgi:dTDP-4-dehydrorhamnose 3,5-epimerase